MNCNKAQQAIIDSLAAGESTLPTEIARHEQSCAACRNYYEAQSRLFRSIDQGVGAIANSSVPASLLPVIRSRFDEQAALARLGILGWPLTALAASALAVIALAIFWHRPRPTQPAYEVRQLATEAAKVEPLVAATPKVSKKSERRLSEPRVSSAPSVAVDDWTQEVMVLPEEREAFARFVAQVPKNPAVALALTRPAPKENEAPVEIALLTIRPLEVKSLEPAEE